MSYDSSHWWYLEILLYWNIFVERERKYVINDFIWKGKTETKGSRKTLSIIRLTLATIYLWIACHINIDKQQHKMKRYESFSNSGIKSFLIRDKITRKKIENDAIDPNEKFSNEIWLFLHLLKSLINGFMDLSHTLKVNNNWYFSDDKFDYLL